MSATAPKRIFFIGGLEFGHRCLEAVLAARGPHAVVGIATLDPALSNNVSGFTQFDDLAAMHDIPLHLVRNINDPDSVAAIAAARPDLILVMGWSQMITQAILEIPPLGVLGIHPTLLPRHRGRAPIPWALIHDLKETGATLLYLDERADHGDIVGQEVIPITDADDGGTLIRRAADAGQTLLTKYLRPVLEGTAPRRPQDHSAATYWPKRTPEDGDIDWHWPGRQCWNWIRGLTHPYPGAFTWYGDARVHLWTARRSDHPAVGDFRHGAGNGSVEEPGTILGTEGTALAVATGDGRLLITRAQWADEPETDAAALVTTGRLILGGRFHSAARIPQGGHIR